MKQSDMESAKVKPHGLFIKKQLNAEVSLKANGFCSQHKPKGSAFCLFVAHVGQYGTYFNIGWNVYKRQTMLLIGFFAKKNFYRSNKAKFRK